MIKLQLVNSNLDYKVNYLHVYWPDFHMEEKC